MPKKTQRAVLVLMPWASPRFPGISVALLRSVLLREGIECDVFYGNLLFSKLTGGKPLYEEELALTPHAELAFSPFYFDVDLAHAARLMSESIVYHSANAEDPTAPWSELLAQVSNFLDLCVSSVPWERYDVVGFSLMFQQTMASLALARRLRAQHPNLKIIAGGPSCALPMGQGLLRSFPELDCIVTGEGDAVIAPLVREVFAGEHRAIRTPGIAYRDAHGNICESGPPTAFDQLDELPTPDYTPYFEQLAAHEISHFEPHLYLETSRGCWWGEKHHCTFCAISDTFMPYRRRSPERVLDDILTMARRHHRTNFLTTDNILDHRAFKSLLPRLKQLREQEGYDLTFFFELKSNITRSQARLLSEAGVIRVQPGIESFSDEVLRLMDKGTTGIQQLQALKILAEFDIEPIWNIVYKNPNERPEHYTAMIEMISFMHHLPPLPATGFVQMLLERYSVYFERPEHHGITQIRPQQFYHSIFPRADIDLDSISFFFDYDRSELHTPELEAVYQRLAEALEQWRRAHIPGSLIRRCGPGFTEILDRRSGTLEVTRLRGRTAELFGYLDSNRNEKDVFKRFAGPELPATTISELLTAWVRDRLVYRSPSGALLNLPLNKGPRGHGRGPTAEAPRKTLVSLPIVSGHA